MLLAAPRESWNEHLSRCLQQWRGLRELVQESLRRVVGGQAEQAMEMVLRAHDVGKLTARWQEHIATGKAPPPHAVLGAAYFWLWAEAEGLDETARRAGAMAIAIHHVDHALEAENLDRPAEQAVMHGLVREGDGKIVWHQQAAEQLAAVGLAPQVLGQIDVVMLRQLASDLRTWSRGAGLLERHRRRMQAAAVHHVLKLCDVRAAAERGEDDLERTWFVQHILEGGWVA